MTASTMDTRAVAGLLDLLRQYGWETGVARLEALINAGRNPADCLTYRYFVAWMAGERGDEQRAFLHLRELEKDEAWRGWAAVGYAFIALRQRNEPFLEKSLADAEQGCGPHDDLLRATILHCRAAAFIHSDRYDEALPLLEASLRLFGPHHFGTGRVLDSLGMAYAAKDNFYAARAFYVLAQSFKQTFRDEAGLALTHGQLGRLYLHWGQLAQAEKHFSEDWKIAARIKDQRGCAQVCNFLGQVKLRQSAQQPPHTAQQSLHQAATWLDDGLSRCDPLWTIIKGFLHKDRAAVALAAGQMQRAEEDAEKAWRYFQKHDNGAGFAEGLAHTNLVLGRLLRAKGENEGSLKALTRAFDYFDSKGQHAEKSLAQFEKARTLRAAGQDRQLVVREIKEALALAEYCRNPALAGEIEAELQEVDPVVYGQRLYERLHGRAAGFKHDLMSGQLEAATIMFLDIAGSTELGRNLDPDTILLTFNQMMSELAPALRKYDVEVVSYLGDGFMAWSRGPGHARRAVAAALAVIEALDVFNGPRRLLYSLGVDEARPLAMRVGVATGEVCLGHTGTYDKISYTAIGTTANLAARLQSEADNNQPCISFATFDQVRKWFTYEIPAGRTIKPKGLPEQKVWDVTGVAVSAAPGV